MNTYQSVARRMGPLHPSNQTLRMADGSLVPSSGIWSGEFAWGLVHMETTFEVFPSGKLWQMLIGKPLLEQVKAVQDYSTDTILLPGHTGHIRIENYKPTWTLSLSVLPTSLSLPERARTTTLDPLPLILQACTAPMHLDVEEDTQALLPLGYSLAHSFTNVHRIEVGETTQEQGQETESSRMTGGGDREEDLADMMKGCNPKRDDEDEEVLTRLTSKGPFHPL